MNRATLASSSLAPTAPPPSPRFQTSAICPMSMERGKRIAYALLYSSALIGQVICSNKTACLSRLLQLKLELTSDA